MTADGDGPDVKQLVDLIDFEIESRRVDARRMGATTWILIATLGALLWTGLREIETSSMSPQNVAALFLVVSLSVDVIRWIAEGFGSERLRPCDDRLVQPAHWLLGKARRTQAYELVRVLLFGLMGGLCQRGVPRPQIVALLLYCAYLAACRVLILLLSSSRLAFPKNLPSGSSTVTTLLPVTGAFAATGYLVKLLASPAIPTIAEIRLACLLAAVMYVGLLLVRQESQDPILGQFVSLRRDLGVGRIDPAQGRQRVDALLYGALLPDLLKDDLEGILRALRQHASELDEALQALGEVASLSPADLAENREHLDQLQIRAIEAMLASRQTQRRTTKLRMNMSFRLGWLSGFSKELETSVREVDEQIKKVEQDIHRKLDEIGEALDRSPTLPS